MDADTARALWAAGAALALVAVAGLAIEILDRMGQAAIDRPRVVVILAERDKDDDGQ